MDDHPHDTPAEEWVTYKVNDLAAYHTEGEEEAFNDLFRRLDDPPRFIDYDVKDYKQTPTGYTITVRPADKTKYLGLEIVTT